MQQEVPCNSHKAAEVKEIVYELEKVADVVSDGGAVRVHLSQVLLVDLAHSCKGNGNF